MEANVEVSTIKPVELVELLKKEKPKMLGGMTDQKAANIIRLAFAQIAKQVDVVEEGDVRIQGLGFFRIRNVTKEGKSIRKVIFRPMKKKPENKGA